MADKATTPELTPEDREAIARILADGEILPCGGRTWAGPFNGKDQPIYRFADPAKARNPVAARRLVMALQREKERGELTWPTQPLYSEHWGCIEHLTFDRRKRAVEPEPEPSYRRAWAPEHPLARGGLVLEHRAVLHDKLGPGPQQCRWCERELLWEAAPGEDDELTVDHLDYDRQNNDPANLVPSCRPCNAARRRGVAASQDEPMQLLQASWATSAAHVSDQGATPATPATPTSPQMVQEEATLETSRPAAEAWARLRRSRLARAAAVAVAVAAGSAVMVTSPTAFLPRVHTDPGPRATTTTSSTTTTAPPAVEAPTSSVVATTEPPATTAWTAATMPAPCLPGPGRCPTLDD